jgi:hypothetical protein
MAGETISSRPARENYFLLTSPFIEPVPEYRDPAVTIVTSTDHLPRHHPRLMTPQTLTLIFIELDLVSNPKLCDWDADVQTFARKHRLSVCVESYKPGTFDEPQAVEVTGPSNSLWSFWEEFLQDEPSQTYGLRLQEDQVAAANL